MAASEIAPPEGFIEGDAPPPDGFVEDFPAPPAGFIEDSSESTQSTSPTASDSTQPSVSHEEQGKINLANYQMTKEEVAAKFPGLDEAGLMAKRAEFQKAYNENRAPLPSEYPIITIPKPSGEGVFSRLTKGVLNVAEGLETPQNIMLAAAAIAAPEAIGTAAGAGFMGQMALHVPEQVSKIVNATTPGDAAEATGELLATGAALGLGGKAMAGRARLGGVAETARTGGAAQDLIVPISAKEMADVAGEPLKVVAQVITDGKTPSPEVEAQQMLANMNPRVEQPIIGKDTQPLTPTEPVAPNPHDYVPAIKVEGDTVKGQPGDTHLDIVKRFVEKNPEKAAAIADFDTTENPNFFMKGEEIISRDQLEKDLGVKDSQGLREKQKQMPQGPGKMTVGELPDQETTGLKRATVERQREEGVVQAAEDRVDADPTVAPALVSRIVDGGDTAISEHEAATLLVERQRVMNERKAWEERVSRGEDVEVGRERLDAIEGQLERLDQAQRAAGSTWGRLGHMYQRLIREDFTLEGMERKERAAKGRPLMEPERAELSKKAEEIAELQKKADAADEATKKASEAEALTRVHEQTIKELQGAQKFGKEVFDVARGIVNRWKTEAEESTKALRSALGQTNVGVDPTIVLHVAKILRAKIGEFGLDKAEAFTQMAAEFGEAVKPYLNEAWKKTQALIGKEQAGPKVRAKVVSGMRKKGEKTAVDAKATLKAEATAEEPLSHKTVYELARAKINEGIHGEDAVMKAVHKDVQEFYPDATERDVRRAFSEYGKVKFPSKEADKAELRELRTLTRLQESIDRATKDSLDPLHTGLQRDKASQVVREKTKQLNEILKKREGPPSPEKLATRNEARVTALKNSIADLDKQLRTGEKPAKGAPLVDTPEIERLRAERNTMKAKLDEIEAETNPPKSEAEKQVDALAKIRTRIDETLSGKTEAKTQKPFEALSTAAEDIKLEIEAMKELAAQMRRDSKPPTDPSAAREKAQIKALEDSIERYSKKVRENDFSTKGKAQGPDTAKVAALKEVRDSRKSMYDAAKKAGKPVKTESERYNETRGKQIKKQIETLQDRIRKGDYAPAPKKVQPALTKSNLDAKAKLESLKNEFREGLEKQRLAQRTGLQKTKERAALLLQSARGIILGSDIGVLTRQGLFAWARPAKAIKATAEAFKAALSPQSMARWEIEVRDRVINGEPVLPKREAAGLSATNTTNHPEELVITRLLSRIPDFNIAGRTIRLSTVAKSLERFQTTFINSVRADIFDAAIREGLSPEELKLRANFINSSTGRGNIKYVPKLASMIFTSPRYESSRWEMLAQPVRNIGALARSGVKGELNRAALSNVKDMAVTIGGIFAVYKLAEGAGYTVNWDPESPDFLKMRKGNEVWDVSAGLAPRLRDVMRTLVAIRHPSHNNNLGKVLLGAGLRTINPAIKTPIEQGSVAVQKAAGEEPKLPFSGFKSDEERDGWITLAPLIWQTVDQSLEDGGVGSAVWTGAREFVGSSVNQYPKKD